MAEASLKSQKNLSSSIRNFIINTKQKKAASIQTSAYFRVRLELLQDHWAKFVERHSRLVPIEDDYPEEEYFVDKLYEKTEEAFLDAKAELLEDLERLTPKTSAAVPPPPVGPPSQALESSAPPALSIPTFDGKQENWESFEQRFTAFINSRINLSPLSKLQHLLNAVRGSAAQRLKGIALTDLNFEIAWDRLVRRYNQPRLRLSSHLEALMQLPSVRHHNARDLTELVDSVEVIVRSLVDLKYPLEHFNHVVVHCLLRKLDSHTKEAWYTSKESTTDFFEYTDLLAFLERRILTLEQNQPSSSHDGETKVNKSHSRSSRSVIANAAQVGSSSKQVCVFCSDSHSIFY